MASFEIEHFESIPSTQLYLIDRIRLGYILENIAVLTDKQIDGIGSRGNSWIGEYGNIFFSVAIQKKDVPQDVPIQSLSIYFSIIMKNILFLENRDIFLKWPNDFYILENKVGGTVTSIVKDFIVIGIGINRNQSRDFGVITTALTNLEIFQKYLDNLENLPSWEMIFEQYLLEFEKSKKFLVNIRGKKVSLQKAMLNFDGSISLNGETLFSLR